MTMKKNKIMLLSFTLVLIITALISIIIFTGNKNVTYDNDKSITGLITKKYSDSDIEKIRKGIEQDNWNYTNLKSHYKIQCLRKTYQGYYAVFLQNDGKRVFVFMDEDMKLYNMLVIDSIKEKKEFDFLEPGKTTESEVLKFDKNTVLLPVSSITSTAHITKEGLLVITYDRLDSNSETLLSDPVVKSFTFYENDNFPLNDDEMININVPYILEKDKK